jgi:hypothetical protein
VEKFLIRSDEFPRNDLYTVERVFGSARTVLCTLSMLSNPVLDTCRIFDVISIQTLIIDEASQINAFDYMVCLATLCLGDRLNGLYSISSTSLRAQSNW